MKRCQQILIVWWVSQSRDIPEERRLETGEKREDEGSEAHGSLVRRDPTGNLVLLDLHCVLFKRESIGVFDGDGPSSKFHVGEVVCRREKQRREVSEVRARRARGGRILEVLLPPFSSLAENLVEQGRSRSTANSFPRSRRAHLREEWRR